MKLSNPRSHDDPVPTVKRTTSRWLGAGIAVFVILVAVIICLWYRSGGNRMNATMNGRLVSQTTGEPVKGANVFLQVRTESPPFDASFEHMRVVSDIAGDFSFEQPREGKVNEVIALASGFLPAVAARPTLIKLRPIGRSDHMATFGRGTVWDASKSKSGFSFSGGGEVSAESADLVMRIANEQRFMISAPGGGVRAEDFGLDPGLSNYDLGIAESIAFFAKTSAPHEGYVSALQAIASSDVVVFVKTGRGNFAKLRLLLQRTNGDHIVGVEFDYVYQPTAGLDALDSDDTTIQNYFADRYPDLSRRK